MKISYVLTVFYAFKPFFFFCQIFEKFKNKKKKGAMDSTGLEPAASACHAC